MKQDQCPVCNSFDIVENTSVYVDENQFVSVCSCNECFAEFHQIYKLQRVEVFDK